MRLGSRIAVRFALATTAASGIALMCSGSAMAAPIDVSDPALAAFTLQYGDFNVVSLGLAQTVTGNNTYNVQSSPGNLAGDIVVGTGPVNNGGFYNSGDAAVTGIDNPYATPNNLPGQQTPLTYFATGNAISAPDPGGAGQFTGDLGNTWDIRTSALQTYLNGETPVFYFNLNETKNGTNSLSGIDLLVWAQVYFTGAGGTSQSFYLAGNPYDPRNPTPYLGFPTPGYVNQGVIDSMNIGAPDATASYPDNGVQFDAFGNIVADNTSQWAYVHGTICADPTLANPFLHYGSCTQADGANAETVDQNLGANDAAFAAYNLQLTSFINNPLWDTMHINWEMAAEDNGYEQLFILAGGNLVPPCTDNTCAVPEPGNDSLFAAGLLSILGLLAFRRVRRKASLA